MLVSRLEKLEKNSFAKIKKEKIILLNEVKTRR